MWRFPVSFCSEIKTMSLQRAPDLSSCSSTIVSFSNLELFSLLILHFIHVFLGHDSEKLIDFMHSIGTKLINVTVLWCKCARFSQLVLLSRLMLDILTVLSLMRPLWLTCRRSWLSGTLQNLGCQEQSPTCGAFVRITSWCQQKLNHSAAMNVSVSCICFYCRLRFGCQWWTVVLWKWRSLVAPLNSSSQTPCFPPRFPVDLPGSLPAPTVNAPPAFPQSRNGQHSWQWSNQQQQH